MWWGWGSLAPVQLEWIECYGSTPQLFYPAIYHETLIRIHNLHRAIHFFALMISTTVNPSSATSRKEKIDGKTLTSRFQTRPTDEESIDIFLLGQLLAILLAHAAAVDDPRALGRILGNRIGEPLSDRGVDFLRLLCGGDLACADGPHGFISDDDSGPIFGLFRDGFELGRHDFDGLVAFSLLRPPVSPSVSPTQI